MTKRVLTVLPYFNNDLWTTGQKIKGSSTQKKAKKHYSCWGKLRNRLEKEKMRRSEPSDIRSHFEEYCSKSSIHGLQYIGDSSRHLAERIVWILAVACSVALGAAFMHGVYTKWQSNPVFVSLATRETPIWAIPFPAVTICDVVRSRSTVFNISEVINRTTITDDEVNTLDTVSLLCTQNLTTKGKDTTDDTVYTTLMRVGTGYSMFWAATLKGGEIEDNLTSLFKPMITRDGICYTFNMQHTNEFYSDEVWINPMLRTSGKPSTWSMTSQYKKGTELHTYPRRGYAHGVRNSLYFHLVSREEDEDYICHQTSPSFKIMIHNPGEIPSVNSRFILASLNSEMLLAITPNLIDTNENLRQYPPQRRNCIFPRERKLRFFREYSRNKCKMECLTNFTLNICGCVAFFMPRTKEMKICGSASNACMAEANVNYRRKSFLSEFESKINTRFDPVLEKLNVDCDCSQACSDLTYDVETSYQALDMKRVRGISNLHFSDTTRLTGIRVYLKVDQFIAKERRELYGITDFISNLGGVLGLFLGFSVLSLFEIAYFTTRRLFCNLLTSSASNVKTAKTKPRP